MLNTRSVGKNAALNTMRVLVSLLFPLITFPYVSRILQVENLGKVTYANSIITYFALFAILGVKTYATREGAALRDDKEKFQQFFSQVFSITLVTTLCAYIVLFFLIGCVEALREYRGILLILSVSILLSTLGTEWVCSVYEDYAYITLRSIAFQMLSLILLFLFVREKNDIYIYSTILVISSAGVNIPNLFYIRKYRRLQVTWHMQFNKHLKPILILFASTLATSIYVSSDITLLGIFCGDYATGLYSVSTKIYSIIKNLLSAVILVAIPRFSYYYANGRRKEFNDLLAAIGGHLMILTLPAAVGLFLVSDLVVDVLSGAAYAPAAMSLRILSIAMLFVAVSWVLAQGVLVPMKQENYVLKTTLWAVVVNVGLNVVLIPHGQQNAAALTTLIAEAFLAVRYLWKVRTFVHPTGLFRELIHAVIGSTMVVLWVLLVRCRMTAALPTLLVCSVGGVLWYIVILLALHDAVVMKYKKLLWKK